MTRRATWTPCWRSRPRAYGFPWTRGNFIDSLAAGYLAEVLLDEHGAALVGYFVAMAGVDETAPAQLTVAPGLAGPRPRPRAARRAGAAMCREQRLADAVARGARRATHARARRLRAPRLCRSRPARAATTRRPGRREDAVVMSLALAGGGPTMPLD